MIPDGVSYIELGEAYLRGDWRAGVSGYWNPLYPCLLGVGLKVLRPTAYWEFPAVHLINFVIYLATLGCFHFFLVGVMGYHLNERENDQKLGLAAMPAWVWLGLGYALFLLSSLEMIDLSLATPDMCVAACVYLATGIIVRIHAGAQTPRVYFLLGICLGFGYLAKAAMLPVSSFYILASFRPGASLRQALYRCSISLAGLVLIAGPYIFALSKQEGHLTFSETPKISFASMVNELPQIHWQGETPGFGKPIHPTRKIFAHPDVFEFGSPVEGSYPPWHDPAYWNAGVVPRLNFSQMGAAIIRNLVKLFGLFLGRFQGGAVAAILVLYLFSPSWRLVTRRIARRWFLFLPPLAAFLLYLPVLAELRYLGGHFTVFCAGLISGFCLPDLPQSRKFLASIMGLVISCTISTVWILTATDVVRGYREAPFEWQVADYVRRQGIRHGDPVGEIGLGFDWGWARLARVRITAEIPPTSIPDFDMTSDELKSAILNKLFSSGIKAIVSSHNYETGCETGWRTDEKTNIHVCLSPERR